MVALTKKQTCDMRGGYEPQLRPNVGESLMPDPGDRSFWPSRSAREARLLRGHPAAMLDEFHDALGDRFGRARRNGALAALRTTLHREEHRELYDELVEAENFAERDPDGIPPALLERIARELADVVYISYGTAHAFGIDLDAAVAEIHRAAMSKLVRPNGQPPVVREDGKVLKPPEFVPPNMAKAIIGPPLSPDDEAS